MARLGFSLVWFALVWFISLFEKIIRGKYRRKKNWGKDLAGKRPSWEKT